MAKGFPERRQNDEALITFIVANLNDDGGDLLKAQFGLSARDVEILDRRFRGLETYQSIGDNLNLTKERIRQILLDLYACFRHPEKRVVWDPNCGAAKGKTAPRELSAVTLDQMLLSLRAQKGLFAMGVRHLSDLVGKTRKDLHSPYIDRATLAEIEREIAEYDLVFRRTAGKRKDDAICRSKE